MENTATQPRHKPWKWDPLVRFTHWAFVAAIILNALVTEEGSIAHIWVGYALAAVLALRIIWGFAGPHNARFGAFPPSPRRAVQHVRDIVANRTTQHTSHNPLGALMVYAIWGTLMVIIASGIAMSGLPEMDLAKAASAPSAHYAEAGEREGGEYGEYGEEGESELLEEAHEIAVNLLYLLIVLHIAGVAFETRRSGTQIIMAMLPWKR
jgi:cytochrome b